MDSKINKNNETIHYFPADKEGVKTPLSKSQSNQIHYKTSNRKKTQLKEEYSCTDVLNFVNWNTMGDSKRGYAELRKIFFAKIVQDIPIDILFTQEHFTKCQNVTIDIMSEADSTSAEFEAIVSSYGSKPEVTMVYNLRTLALKQIINPLASVRELSIDTDGNSIFSGQFMKNGHTRFQSVILQVIDSGIEFIAINFHSIYSRFTRIVKVLFVESFFKYASKLSQKHNLPVLVAGDFNIDISDGNLFTLPSSVRLYLVPEERAVLKNKEKIDIDFVCTIVPDKSKDYNLISCNCVKRESLNDLSTSDKSTSEKSNYYSPNEKKLLSSLNKDSVSSHVPMSCFVCLDKRIKIDLTSKENAS